MPIPDPENTTGARLQSFVEHHAEELITGSGSLCELANNYSNLDSYDKAELFNTCKEHLALIQKLGKIVQDDIDHD